MSTSLQMVLTPNIKIERMDYSTEVTILIYGYGLQIDVWMTLKKAQVRNWMHTKKILSIL